MSDTIVAPSTTTSSSTNQVQNLLTHIKSTSDAIDKGDILGSAMGVANVALDVIGVAGDPLGAISSAGVGWVLNAVKFLREPFDILMGNPSAITGSAQSWSTAAQGLSNTAQVYRQASTTQTTSWTGAAGTGYRTTSANQADGLQALAQASQAVSSAMKTAGQAVAQARQTVMNLISQAVQQIITICIEALASSWLSFGASIAKGIAQSVQKAVTTATKTMQKVKDVVEKLQKIIKTVQQIVQLVQQVKQLLAQIGGKASDQPVLTPQITPVSYTVQSQGLDPNNMGVYSSPGTPAAPGYQWQQVPIAGQNATLVAQAPATPAAPGYQWRQVPIAGENSTTAAQFNPQAQTGPQVQAVPQFNPQATQTSPQSTVQAGPQLQAPPQVNPNQATRGAAQQPVTGAQPVQAPRQAAPAQTGGRVSQNGWPVNPQRSAHTIPGTNIRVTVADGDAGEVLMHVLGQVNSRVEGVELNGPAGEHDDWGYADRNVRGSHAISNHASATAVDINATRHVLGAQGTFTPSQTTEIHSILGEVDNVVRWGGDYTGRRDEMHFEIIGTQEEVARVAERLRQAQQPH
ncbi:M15 family metallopeptidase [Actinophytocola sp.]|uniref:M15 family metallopeptidase n=1 Tax=Actinophytocola sp. TaxID=1872138 RepID=UPI002D413A4B|nr:M15 family metallopeptidase [Actinophytocola sp.]HYQ63187.1 M15 family metallopeptidase [Actinophytocola sp.]